MSFPAQHISDAQKLESDAIVTLFEIETNTGSIVYLRDGESVEWQGNVYEGIAIHMTGAGSSADEEVSRPTLTIANPAGAFKRFVFQGLLEKGLVRRKRVLRENLEANRNVYEQQTWMIAMPGQVNREIISLSLRQLLDGPNYFVPGRTFSPPDFPMVTF